MCKHCRGRACAVFFAVIRKATSGINHVIKSLEPFSKSFEGGHLSADRSEPKTPDSAPSEKDRAGGSGCEQRLELM